MFSTLELVPLAWLHASIKQRGLGLSLWTNKTRKAKYLDEMQRLVPWAALVQMVEPHCPRSRIGRRRSRSRRTCAFTTFSNGSACRILRWKRRCTTRHCLVWLGV